LRDNRDSRDEDTPNKLYADVAHPINQSCRDLIQQHVVDEYHLELERAKTPGYVSRYDDAYESVEAGTQSIPHTDRSDGLAVPPPHFKQPTDQKRSSSEQSRTDDSQRPPAT
jgi:stage V sporulation protein G